ncbi:lytic transglycosylase domain-containing protein [Phenylobacterium sp. 58.2.17]|uniref:lytic transglycosylase domain-containing protein n=1 Tax=Phenylobacterium sp. 58.2.17 TaxID=2969306 RepID=UPI0022642FFB|nr:lytic transglycosylase domain-containing protein [Phenylobacterium sp. 58.2.17]MCX7587291.1 lytic transglycosylase domain-containing protein [Phenylobacterium sp. 58.2.17]
MAAARDVIAPRRPIWIGLIALLASPCVGLAAEPAPGGPQDDVAVHIAQASRRFGLPEAWISAVVRAESAGDPRAVSRAGAMGLMQIMPATWTELRVRYGLGTDPFDPRDNILAGSAYLRELHDRYGVAGFLAAYNAGPGRYEDSLTTGRPLPAETRAYLAKLSPVVGASRGGDSASADPDAVTWRRSALFPGRSDIALGADQGAGDPRADHQIPAGSDTPLPVPVPGLAELFVPVSSRSPAR